MKIFPSKHSESPSEKATLKSLKSKGRNQQTFFIEHHEESAKQENYFSDFGDPHNVLNSSRKEPCPHEVTNDGKILAKLHREKGVEPFLIHDHSTQLNEKRRIKKINSKITHESPVHKISPTIILDLEAELDLMNQQRENKTYARERGKTPEGSTVAVMEHRQKFQSNLGQLNDQGLHAEIRDYDSLEKPHASEQLKKEEISIDRGRVIEQNSGASRKSSDNKSANDGQLTNGSGNQFARNVQVLSEFGIKEYKGSVYGIENLDQTATKHGKPVQIGKNEKVWDEIFQKRQVLLEPVQTFETDTHESNSNQSSFRFLRESQPKDCYQDKENYYLESGINLPALEQNRQQGAGKTGVSPNLTTKNKKGTSPVVDQNLKYSLKSHSIDPIMSQDQDLEQNESQLTQRNRQMTSEQNEDCAQEKLTRARKRMRQFKKKLGLMKVFIEKYEKRALEKGSQEIYSAVMILVEEHEKHDYGLNQEESEVIDRMKTFGNKFCQLWGAGETSQPSSGFNQTDSGQILAKLRTHDLSDKVKGA